MDGARTHEARLAIGAEIRLAPSLGGTAGIWLEVRAHARSSNRRVLSIVDGCGAGRAVARERQLELVVLRSTGASPGAVDIEGAIIPLAKTPLTVGRARNWTDVGLYVDTSSRKHALFELREDGFWVTDEQSTNGIWVDGVRIQQHRLVVGETLFIGDGPRRRGVALEVRLPSR